MTRPPSTPTILNTTISRILLGYQKLSSHTSKPLIYTSLYVPEISLSKYIERISTYSSLEDNVLISAIIYIDRYLSISKVDLTSHEVHRLLLTAIVIAIKFHCDEFFDNAYYAAIGGITMEELNDLEKDLIEALDYRLYIEEELYKRYMKAVISYGSIYVRS